jgi:uncharacterized protein YkwD
MVIMKRALVLLLVFAAIIAIVDWAKGPRGTQPSLNPGTATRPTEKPEPPQEPGFYRNLAAPGAELDAGAAQSMISGYRQNNGFAAVELDPVLMQMAQEHARIMAARDNLDHGAGRSFNDRIKASGYNPKFMAENIGAGYRTLADAFSGWRDSPSHRMNMLLPAATRMGIAAVYTPASKYRVFWSLILAASDASRG